MDKQKLTFETYSTAVFKFSIKFVNTTWKTENLNAWYEDLKDMDKRIFLRAMDVLGKMSTLPFNFNLSGKIEELAPQIGRELRDELDEASRYKQLPMSQKQQEENDKARKEFAEWNKKLKTKMKGE